MSKEELIKVYQELGFSLEECEVIIQELNELELIEVTK